MSAAEVAARPITRELAAFASALRYEDLPPASVEMGKRVLLDGMGCLIAGAAGEHGRNATAMVRGMGGEPQATLITDLKPASVRDAAFVNGVCLYSVGLNDIHKPAGSHPAGCIIPVVLAMGEWRRTSGSLLLAAMAAGYELVGRIGRAVRPSHRERGFHPTGTCGTFGATATAVRLLGLDAARSASALGIAGSQAAGLYECHHDGTSTMIFHAGRAAQNGVEAALLAQAGFTGPATVLEGSKGFFQATANAVDATAMADFGARLEMDETSFRPYFGCNSTIAASGATAAIVREVQGLQPEHVERVTVYCNAVPAHDNADADPQTLLAARLSLPFNIALVLVHGDVLAIDLDEPTLRDKRIRALLPKINVVCDLQMSRYGARVQVLTHDGRVFENTITDPRGSPTQPLSWDDVTEKFCRLVHRAIEAGGQQRVIDAVWNIEALDGVDLMRMLREAMAKSVRLHNFRTITLAVAMFFASAASAQSFPAKPVRLVTSSVGGGGDFAARLIASELYVKQGSRVIVDNRGGGVLAGEIVAKAAPDGYTLLLYGSTIWLAPFLQEAIGYRPERDFAAVTLPISAPNVIVVHPSLPVHTVKELIAISSAKPGELNYASGATGSANHLGAELFKSMARVNIVQVNYKGTGAAMNDLISGQVHMMFANAASVSPHVKVGRLRALAVTSAQPSALTPGLPTVAASGLPGYESSSVWGVFAPAGTPAAIIGQLNRDMVNVLETPAIKQKFFAAGMEVVGSTPEALAAVVRNDMTRLGAVLSAARPAAEKR